jgi:hypothetical protein
MKLALLAAPAFAIAAVSTASGGDDVRAVRRGHAVALSSSARLADNLARELESCSVNIARWGPAADMWDHALASDSYLHATYSPPRKMTLHAQDNLRSTVYEVQEILLPLPEDKWPPYDLARIGGEVYAYAKCDPVRLMDIIREPEIRMQEIHPYKSLLDAMRVPRRRPESP